MLQFIPVKPSSPVANTPVHMQLRRCRTWMMKMRMTRTMKAKRRRKRSCQGPPTLSPPKESEHSQTTQRVASYPAICKRRDSRQVSGESKKEVRGGWKVLGVEILWRC